MQVKPLRGAALNNTHPLARDLILSYIQNEGTGAKVFDTSRNSKDGSMVDFVSPKGWVGGKYGWAIDYAANDHISVALPKVMPSVYPVSMAVILDPSTVSYSSGTRHALFCYSDFSASDQYMYLLVGDSGGNLVAGAAQRAGGGEGLALTGAIQSFDRLLISANFISDTERVIMCNGIVKATNTTSVTFPTGLDVGTVGARSGASAWAAADKFNGIMNAVWVWKRYVKPEEFLQMTYDPYAMYRKDSVSKKKIKPVYTGAIKTIIRG